MKKVLILTLTFLFSFINLVGVVSASGAAQLYVAPGGNDSGDGSIDAPFATIEAALEAADSLSGKVVINLRGGSYPVTETIKVSRDDLVIRSYMSEEAVFTGSSKIEASAFKKVTDKEILDRIVTKSAREKIWAADFKAVGITEFAEINPVGFQVVNNTDGRGLKYAPVLFVNGKRLVEARYPNEEYIYTGAVAQMGSTLTDYLKDESTFEPSIFEIQDDRWKNWTEASDIWAFGYFQHDWAEANVPVTLEDGKFTTGYPAYTGVVSDRRVYFYNLLEELDTEGEWYLDREAGIAYIFSEAAPSGNIEFSAFNTTMMEITDSKNVEVKGIKFENAASEGVVAFGCENVTIADCEFANLSNNCVWIQDSWNCTVTGNYIHDGGSLCVKIISGDRLNLKEGGCVVENNLIHSYGQIKTCYVDGVSLNGWKNVARYNKVYDAPHVAFGGAGLFEYNDVSNVCHSTADSGAFYTGGSFLYGGVEIMNNYFHDLKMINTNTGMEMQAVYFDDEASYCKANGNIFYKCSSVALFGGGRGNEFRNNIILECEKPFVLDNRGESWQKNTVENNYIPGVKAAIEADTPYINEYSFIKDVLTDEPGVPKYNNISNNVEYRSAGFNIAESAKATGTIENNIELKNTDMFVDYKNKDFRIKDMEAFGIEGFEPVDFAKIGLRDDEIKSVKDESTVLFIGSPRAIANGAETFVDKDNLSVMPQIINSRTLVPVRFIAESTGAEVLWDGGARKVTVKGDKTIEIVLDEMTMTVDGEKVELDAAAQIISDRTMLPLRAICEALGKQVFWDDRGLIIIGDNAEAVSEKEPVIVDAIIRAVTVE